LVTLLGIATWLQGLKYYGAFKFVVAGIRFFWIYLFCVGEQTLQYFLGSSCGALSADLTLDYTGVLVEQSCLQSMPTLLSFLSLNGPLERTNQTLAKFVII
jgi:hypothetical protein